MADLIDLKSPDGKSATGPKLASPLIPAPTKSASDEKAATDSTSANCGGLNFAKRHSLENNPFDCALHKTVDYARKLDDPFELVLEKALKNKETNSLLTPKARSVEFKDDFTPKRTRHSDILKMNKTLDDSLIEAEFEAARNRKISLSPCGEDSIIHDLDNTSLLDDKSCENKNSEGSELPNGQIALPVIPRLCLESPSANDLSILNQSAMNDSLTESCGNYEESLLKSIVAKRISLCIKKGTSEANLAVPNHTQGMRRSLSQSDNKLSPRKFRQRRSKSIVDTLQVSAGTEDENSVGCMPSYIFEDNMNRAFLESQCRNVSTISDLNNVSAITRFNSVSSSYDGWSCSSSSVSNRTANCAFIENSRGNSSAPKSSSDKIEENSARSSAGSLAAIFKSPGKESPINGGKDISDLLSKYSQLRVSSSDLPTARLPSIISGSGIVNRSDAADKLIDVDVFVPATEELSSLERNPRQSVSSTSSDSVFLDNTSVGKSITAEAKSLAKTFEELALKTGSSCSNSSSDDLINSRPRWNFDVLPISDDEAPVDDLIDLPNSPEKRNSSQPTPSAEESAIKKSSSSSEEKSDAKSEKSMLKELETEFIAPEKKIVASSLLLELENLVKSEGNPEAAKLLESLEKALGVQRASDSELLASCFSTPRNDLTKSPRRPENPIGTENIKNESNEKSREDNLDVDSSESLKQLSLSDDKSLRNNFNIEKPINKSDKSLVLGNEKYDQDSPEEEEKSPENSYDDMHDDSITELKRENRITDDQKMAVEILVGLGKLLTGENKDPMTANVLKNLGRVLNLAASKTCDGENNFEVPAKSKETGKRVNTPIKSRVATPPRKSTPLSAFSRSANRRSLDTSLKAKTPNERNGRRSISTTQTPSSTTPRVPIKPLSSDKSKAHLKEVKKRFSSDPGFPSVTVNNSRRSSKDGPFKQNGDISKHELPSSTVADVVKSKFRKKIDSDIPSKRGPMKALIPLGNMQRQGSFRKRVSPLTGSVTPPKPGREISSTCTLTTSTPFAVVHLACPKKSPKTKPMASSTPDCTAPKNGRRLAPPVPPSPGNKSFSCNISPVTSKTDEADDDNSSKENSKSSKLSKIGTPSKSRSASQLPKLSPMLGMKSSPNKSPRGQRRSEPLQSFLPRSLNPPKSPAIRVTEAVSGSLNTSNKLGSKVKPLNLISKLRHRSSSAADKENYA